MLTYNHVSAAIIENAALFGSDGELVTVRISVDPPHLEDVLESLASLDFPVNPELIHSPLTVTIAFPAYAAHVGEIRASLAGAGLDPAELSVSGVLAAAARTVS